MKHTLYTKSCLCNSCNMGIRDLPEMYARGLWAYLSEKSQVPMLQLIFNTSILG